MNLRHVLHKYGGTVDGLYRNVVEIGKRQRTAIDLDLILGAGQFRGARRKNQVLQIQGVRNIDRRELFGVQLVQIQIHHDSTRLAAERIGN